MIFMTARQVSDEFGVSFGTLGAYRARGKGPPFIKTRYGVRYRRSDIEAWIPSYMLVKRSPRPPLWVLDRLMLEKVKAERT